MLDASEGVTAQDAHIAGYADDAGRAIVLAVNKWDLVPPGLVQKADVIGADLRAAALPRVRAGLLHLGGDAHQGLRELFDQVDLRGRGGEEARAAGRLLTDAAPGHRAAADVRARRRAARLRRPSRSRYRPPTFAVRVNLPTEIHFSYQRYLLNSLRHGFGFAGSPIRAALPKGGGGKRLGRAPRASGRKGAPN